MKVITVVAEASVKETFITQFLHAAQTVGKNCWFAKSCEHLDIDTPNKDSYELFEAGLDFAMLVTDKHGYLKARDDISPHVPMLDTIDWVIQDGEVYPTDTALTVTEHYIESGCGRRFSVEALTALVTWLERKYGTK